MTLALALALGAPALAESTPEENWTAKCASCHGANGKADTKLGKKHKVDDVTTAQWQSKHSDADIKKAIEDGVPGTKMKGFKDKLAASEIDALVKHTRSLKQ